MALGPNTAAPFAARPKVIANAVVSVIWLTLLFFGFRSVWKYEATAGATGPAPTQWPAGAPVSFDPARSNLVMLAHPKCPCTRASVAELTRLLTQAHGALTASVLFYTPTGEAGWENEGLWKTVAAIPGVQVAADPDGIWAQRFGAETSGQVVLFDRRGQILFRGGITGARGHEGDNAGENIVLALALGQAGSDASTPRETPVFGCEIFSPEAHPEKPSLTSLP